MPEPATWTRAAHRRSRGAEEARRLLDRVAASTPPDCRVAPRDGLRDVVPDDARGVPPGDGRDLPPDDGHDLPPDDGHDLPPDSGRGGARRGHDGVDELGAHTGRGLLRVLAVVPASLRHGRWSVGASAVVALLVLVGVAAAASAVRTAQAAPGAAVPARSTPDPAVPTVPAEGAVGPASPGAGPATPGSAATSATGAVPGAAIPASLVPPAGSLPAGGGPVTSPPGAAGAAGGTLVVHVVGAVAAAGVVTLAAGARVGDAVAAAGGAEPGADLARLNLARLLADGEQVVVLRPGEEPPVPVPVAGAATSPAVAGGAGNGPSSREATPLDLNAATLQELDTLPGIGPVLAQRIVDWRTEHGGFSAVGELREVSGIGDAVMADLEPLVRV